MRSFAITVLLLLTSLLPAHAQVQDDFDDGDLSVAPRWSGDLDRWMVEEWKSSPALRLNGEPARDTVAISTPSAVSYGRWRMDVRFDSLNLSTFNGLRWILASDRPEPWHDARALYLQWGTNNTDEMRLYLQDGPLSTSRMAIAAAAWTELPDSSQSFTVEVSLDREQRLRVRIDGEERLTVEHVPPVSASHTGLWIRHTEPTRQAYWIDELEVTPAPDTEPPRLTQFSYHTARAEAELTFSEPVDSAALGAWRIQIDDAPVNSRPRTTGLPRWQRVTLRTHPLAPGPHELSLGGIRDAAGNVLRDTTLAFALLPPEEMRAIVINEIMAIPNGDDPEWIEIVNVSDVPIPADSIRFRDAAREASPVRAPGRLLQPGELFCLAEDSAAFAARFPDVAVAGLSRWPSLNDGGDAIYLHLGDGVQDSLAYSGAAVERGRSLERRVLTGGAHPANWMLSTDPAGSTPGRENSIATGPLEPLRLLFAEERAAGGLLLYFSHPLRRPPEEVRLASVILPSCTLRDDELSLACPLPASADGDLVTASGVTDVFGRRVAEATRPLARAPQSGELLLTEILFAPLQDAYDGRPDQPEYVELLNRSSHLLTLNDLLLLGRVDEEGVADTTRFETLLAGLPAGERATLHASPASLLPAAFPGAAKALSFAAERTTLALANAGDSLRLWHPRTGTLVEAGYDAEWLDPARRGTALELLEPPSGDTTWPNWGPSRSASGGTPGQINSLTRPPADAAPPTLRISEVFYAPADTMSTEWIELVHADDEASWLHAVGLVMQGDTLVIARRPRALAPGQRVVVTSGAAAKLDRRFPSTQTERMQAHIYDYRPMRLPNEEGAVAVIDVHGRTLDSLRYMDDWHQDALGDHRGRSLERRSTTWPTTSASNWTTSVDPEGATPGAANSVSQAESSKEEEPGFAAIPEVFSPDGDGRDDVTALTYLLPGTGGAVRCRIFDARGRLVRHLEATLSGSSGQLIWDGRRGDGSLAPTGLYVALLEAVDEDGQAIYARKTPIILAAR